MKCVIDNICDKIDSGEYTVVVHFGLDGSSRSSMVVDKHGTTVAYTWGVLTYLLGGGRNVRVLGFKLPSKVRKTIRAETKARKVEAKSRLVERHCNEQS